ncbi:MAG TPA: hypothetical protein VNU97_03900 [Rhizomicrobium sp.]|jgi:hypothetical protein|nr:hypothetical protein [Rhizomicrobium sp.]
MEQSTTTEATMCRDLAAAMRLDATRATLPGFAARLVRGAEDLERHATVLSGWAPMFL